MANRRRSSVSFQLRDAHFAAHLPSNGTHRDSDVEITSSFVRAALPLPLLAFGLGMAAMGGWIWVTPALVFAGLELYRGASGHIRRLSASDRARRASSGANADIVGRIRGKTLSLKFCCICLDTIPDDEPCFNLFDCKHDTQTHKVCIDKWLEKHETCPLCRRDAKDPVIGEMKKYPHNVAAQIRGCRFIVFKGWQNAEFHRHLIEIGAAELVANALDIHSSDPSVLAACCAAIFVLAFSDRETQERLSSFGVCQRIVEGMLTFSEDIEVQTRGCGAIYSLSLSNKQIQRQLCLAKAPAAVLNALQQFMGQASVAMSAADAIMSLSCDNKLGQDLLGIGEGAGVQLGGKGACELLAEVIDRYSQDRDVIYAALDAVMKMAIDNPENRLRFGAVGMCSKVMDAFNQYQDDEVFLLVALTAVYTMAENQRENQTRLLEGNKAEILMSTLWRHEGFMDVVSVGLDVIFALTYDPIQGLNTRSHPALQNAGACGFILKMLQTYPRNPEIYGPGLKATACFLTSNEMHSSITGPDWCQVVCNSMKQSLELEDVPVLEICCRVLGQLAIHEKDNQALLRRNGACEMICDCLRKGFSKWEALQATADLAYDCQENRHELGQRDCVALLIKCIEKDPEDWVALDIALMALSNIVQDHEQNASCAGAQMIHLSTDNDCTISIYAFLSHLLESDQLVFGERACIIMMVLSVLCANDPTAQSKIGGVNGCWAVVQRLRMSGIGSAGDSMGREDLPRRYPDMSLLRQGVQLMSDLATAHSDNQERLQQADGLNLLLQVLPDFFSDSSDVVQWLVTVTALLEGNPNNQRHAGNLKMCGHTVKLLKGFSNDTAVVESALRCLVALATNNRENQKNIGSLGGCDLVHQVVSKFSEDSHLLVRSCSLILALCETQKNDSSGRPLHIWKDSSYNNKHRFRKGGMVPILMQAFINHINGKSESVVLGNLILSLALLAEDDLMTSAQLRNNSILTLTIRLVLTYPDDEMLFMAAGGLIASSCVVFNDKWTDWIMFETPLIENQDLFIHGNVFPYIIGFITSAPIMKSSVVMSFVSLAALAWQNEKGISLLRDSIGVLSEILSSDVVHEAECMFYGLLVLGSMISLPKPDEKIMNICASLIFELIERAQKLFPDNLCIKKICRLLFSHIQRCGGRARLLTAA